jgi:hypothetical protein
MGGRLFLCGLGIWIGANAALRLAGQHLLRPGDLTRTLVLFAFSFPATAWIVCRLCRRFQLRRDEWPVGAVSLLLPTLLLDPFSSMVFPVVFPNMAPEVAGTFGRWMLWCCAGAFIGVVVRQRSRS